MAQKVSAKKSGQKPCPNARTSIWDVVLAATTSGWSATLRLCAVLGLICCSLIIAAVVNARALGALTTFLGG
jgi:hypothetical protein